MRKHYGWYTKGFPQAARLRGSLVTLKNLEEVEETFRLSRELKPDYALYNILTPLPGTEIYQKAREEGRLAASDWGRYTGSEPILEIPGLSGEYISDFYRKAYLRFYLDPGFLLRRLKKVRSLPELLRGGWSFAKLLRM